jgi:hypothetical protein
MKQVLKFKLSNTGNVTELALPLMSTILTVQYQRDDLMLWAMCYDTERTEARKIRLVCTGEELHHQTNLEFIASVFKDGYMFHLFEEHD